MTSPSAALRSLPVELPEDAGEALASIGQVRAFASGAVLVQEGVRSDAFWVVVDGRLKMTRFAAGGRELILTLLLPAQVFGVAAALGGRPNATSVTALTPSRCLEVKRSALFGLLARRPALAEVLLPLLTGHMRECTGCMVEASCSRVENRLAEVLLRLAGRLGEIAEGGILVPLRLSRQDLADLAATTLETAIRVMSRWSSEGVVETRPDGFLVRQPAVLERLRCD